MKRIIRLPFLAASTLLFMGCAAEYQLGTTLPEDCRDVYIPAILNQSGEPRAAVELRRALEKEIRREGTLRIVDEADATTRLDVIVVDYDQQASSFSHTSTQSPSEYRMVLTASVSFVKLPRPEAGEMVEIPIFVKDNATGKDTFTGGSDAIANKMACLPDTAKNLAETIVDGCVGAW